MPLYTEWAISWFLFEELLNIFQLSFFHPKVHAFRLTMEHNFIHMATSASLAVPHSVNPKTFYLSSYLARETTIPIKFIWNWATEGLRTDGTVFRGEILRHGKQLTWYIERRWTYNATIVLQCKEAKIKEPYLWFSFYFLR